MKITGVKSVYLFQLTMVTMGVLICGFAIFKGWLCNRYIPAFAFIPLFNVIYSLCYIFVYCFFRREFPEKVTLFYLAAKMIKMVLAMIVITLFCFLDHENRILFSVLFFATYMVYMAFDSAFFVTHEVRQKNKKKNE